MLQSQLYFLHTPAQQSASAPFACLQYDLEFDSDHARGRITAMFSAAGIPVTFTTLRYHQLYCL